MSPTSGRVFAGRSRSPRAGLSRLRGVTRGTTMTTAERQVRAARNQMLFRSVNERIRELGEKVMPSVGEIECACECEDESCAEVISISIEEFRAIETGENQFIVKP